MSSVPKTAAPRSREAIFFSKMAERDLSEVLKVEHSIYPYPWTRGNFQDSISCDYETWITRDSAGALVGYFLLMPMVSEAHLLNITVPIDRQGHGIGRLLLDKAVALALARGLDSMLLEVRPSNHRALQVYREYGFLPIGTRKNYYPAANDLREDAIVMRLAL